MLIIDKKLIDECEFEAEREFLLENSKEVEVVDINQLNNEWIESRGVTFEEYATQNGYQLIKIKQ